MLGGMVAAAFLMAAGGAAKHYGPTLHIHHGLPDSLRGPLHGIDLSMSGTEFGVVFILLGVCYLGVLAFADSVRVRVGLGAISFSTWPLNTTAYGPLFTLASLPLGLVSFATAIWVLKSVSALAGLGCVGLVWACAARLGRPPLPAALFFGLNPVLLAYAVGGAHNDLLMLVAALGGIYLLLGGRESGMVALVGAVAVKSSSVVLLPFALLGSRRPARALVWGVSAAAVTGAITVLAFGTHVSSLLHVLQRDARLETPNDVPGLINNVLGLGLANDTLGRIGMLVLVATVALLLVRVYRGGDWFENAGWATCAVIVTTT
jgi:alpha-1,6-mannosyltransferase